MTTEPDPRDAEFEAQFEALRKHFRAELPTRRAALLDAWDACRDDSAEEAWQRLRDVAHKLSGSAPSYGLDAVGLAARAIDRLLSARPPCRRRANMDAAVAALRAELDQAIAAG